MPDLVVLAGLLLVVGPVLGAIPVANPSLLPVWSASREDHLAIVGAHRRAWAVLNAGFSLATVSTAAGLALLAADAIARDGRDGALLAVSVAYAMGGIAWLAVLAIRTRTTPALADLVAAGAPTEPAETLLGAAIGGLFASFVIVTGLALVALGLEIALQGGVAVAIGGIAALIALVVLVTQLARGDSIPAILYFPTLIVGLAILAGWR